MSSTHISPSEVKLTSILSLMISSAASALGASRPVTVTEMFTVADQDLVNSHCHDIALSFYSAFFQAFEKSRDSAPICLVFSSCLSSSESFSK